MVGIYGNELVGIYVLEFMFKMFEVELIMNLRFIFKGKIVGLWGNLKVIWVGKRFIEKDFNC